MTIVRNARADHATSGVLPCTCQLRTPDVYLCTMRMRTGYLVLASVSTSVVDKVKDFFFFLLFLFLLSAFLWEGGKGCGLYPPGLSVTSVQEVKGQVKG